MLQAKKIILIGESSFLISFAERFNTNSILILYQYKPDKKLINYCKNTKIKLSKFTHSQVRNENIKVVIEFNKMISRELLSFGVWLNIHAGILPKWRGVSANLWALLDCEKELGLTLHVMNDNFDDGDIIHIEKIANNQEKFYYDLKNSMVTNLSLKLPQLIDHYIEGTSKLIPNTIKSSKIEFCRRMRTDYSTIRNLDIPHDQIVSLYRIFGHENNSGFYFSNTEKTCMVIQLYDAHFNEEGKNGEIISRNGGLYLIKTNGGGVWVEPEEGLLFEEIMQGMVKNI